MFEPINFIKNAGYMGEGMLTILLVMLVIIAVTVILNKLTGKKK